jgi:DNA-binding transcriptional LysR family regulator
VIVRQLEYLAALAREGHFGRAAASCHVSQPTLSAGIRRLEEELGLPIVRRTQRYEGLTPEGERVLEWAQRILADVDGLRGEVGAMRHGLSGRLRIGAIPTSLSSVSLLTTPLAERHPGVTVAVHSLNSMQIERGLQAFDLDVGFTYLDSEPLTGVRALPLYRERYVLLTRADGPFGDRPAVPWAEAATVPLALLTEDMQNRRIVNGIFREAGAAPQPTVETNSISTLYAHVRDGAWSAVMARRGSTCTPCRKACVRSRSWSRRPPARSASFGSTAIPSRCSRARCWKSRARSTCRQHSILSLAESGSTVSRGRCISSGPQAAPFPGGRVLRLRGGPTRTARPDDPDERPAITRNGGSRLRTTRRPFSSRSERRRGWRRRRSAYQRTDQTRTRGYRADPCGAGVGYCD